MQLCSEGAGTVARNHHILRVHYSPLHELFKGSLFDVFASEVQFVGRVLDALADALHWLLQRGGARGPITVVQNGERVVVHHGVDEHVAREVAVVFGSRNAEREEHEEPRGKATGRTFNTRM